ncbi:MAG: ferrochelatase [Polyangiales bacterium]
MQKPFDAVLVVSFGGPQGLDDIRPFLANVLRGRRVSPERLEEVAHHYEFFGGVSPITELTMRQAAALSERLQRFGPALPVYVGMRNWKPFLADTLAEMSAAGVRRAIGLITAAQKTYSSCGQYKQNVADARKELARRGLADVEVTFVDDWNTHAGFIAANAARVADALAKLPAEVRDAATVVFTAHSIPTSMATASVYERNFEDAARAVMALLRRPSDWALTYQSRSGRPEDPWLTPDVNDFLKAEHAKGELRAVVLCPIGFLCDHVEVLWDLDREAVDTCNALGLPVARAKAVNDHPLFADLMADVVRTTYARNAEHRRLTIVPANPPERVEGPPPHRGRPAR